jgi:hypothetical protein
MQPVRCAQLYLTVAIGTDAISPQIDVRHEQVKSYLSQDSGAATPGTAKSNDLTKRQE